jgi:23S rRNA (adenine-N6)-dimethyltransferase
VARSTAHPHARTSPHRFSDRERARRELSQNFLTARAARRFIDTARPREDEVALEVGAGRGALTALLAQRCRAVIAYEIDPRHARTLRERAAAWPSTRVRVVPGDFLAARAPGESFAVYGNVPFSRTADVVAWCLAAPRLTDATLITQWEYARKRTGDYGRWSRQTVRTWPVFDWRLLGRVSRTEFRPVPRVDAGIMRLTRRAQPLLPRRVLADYEALVDIGFAGRGGSLYASLRGHVPRRLLDRAFDAGAVGRTDAVGHVSPRQWLGIATAVLRG